MASSKLSSLLGFRRARNPASVAPGALDQTVTIAPPAFSLAAGDATRDDVPPSGPIRLGRPLPLIGHLPQPQQMKILGGLLALIVLLGLLIGVWLLRTTTVGASYIAAAAQMQTLSQRIAKAAQQVLLGSPEAVTERLVALLTEPFQTGHRERVNLLP